MAIDRISTAPTVTSFNQSNHPKDTHTTETKTNQIEETHIENKFKEESGQEANEKKVPKDELQEVVEGLNEFLTPAHTSLKFELHEKLDEYYVKIIDDATKDVIREIPSKKMMDMYAAMKEYMGLIIDEKV